MSSGPSRHPQPTPAQQSRREFLKTSASAAVLASVGRKAALLHAFEFSSEDALRARLAADPLRPQYHLLPAKNWMNDPNGPIHWKGHYHMFFQYNPNAAVWGDMHWNHAVSEDMIHWRHLPIALAPTPGWDDADGCFTGSAVDDHGTATILYTGVKTVSPEAATLRDGVAHFRETQCLATSNDPMLRAWEKYKTPVIEPPQDPNLTGFRDPFLWRDAATWYLGVASGQRRVGGQVLLYRSHDLRKWEYLHPLATGKWTERESKNPVDSGEMWECPDFFSLGKKWVLLYSTAGGVYWEVGDFDPKELVFHSEKRGILDHGAYYAQKTQLDAHGNRVLWGWITEKRPDSELRKAGWAGCMALPRVLLLGADSELEMRFAPNAESLRAKKFSFPKGDSSAKERFAAAKNFLVENVAGEFLWSAAEPSAKFTFVDDNGPWVSLAVEASSDSSARLTVNGQSIDIPPGADSQHSFHLFLDASVAELICDQKHAITSRINRTPAGPLRISPTESDLGQLTSLEAWQLRAISRDRLTT